MTLHIERPKPAAPPFRERRGLPAAAPIRLAHIVSVSGSSAVAVLERQDAIMGEEKRVQIGALIKVVTPHASVMGAVTAVSAPMPAADGEPQPLGLIEIESLPQPVTFLDTVHGGVLKALAGQAPRDFSPSWAESMREVAEHVRTAPTPTLTMRAVRLP